MPETAPAPPTDYPFGFVLFNTNQRIDSAELTNIGEMALRAMTALLSRMVADEPSTFPSGFFGDDCKVTVDSGLTMDVAAGIGFFNYNAYDVDDHDHVVYRPIAFNGDQVTLGAHHATLGRIDIISIAPNYEDVAEESRQIWDPGTESFGPENVYTRRVVSYTLTVTAGTPHASPAAPATPAGHIKLAECAVPATSGAVDVTDVRPLLLLAPSLLQGVHSVLVTAAGGYRYPATGTTLQVRKVLVMDSAPISSPYGTAAPYYWVRDDSGTPFGAEGGAYLIAGSGTEVTNAAARYPVHNQGNEDLSLGGSLFILNTVTLHEFERPAAAGDVVVFTLYTVTTAGVRADVWSRTYNDANPTGTGNSLTGLGLGIAADKAIYFEIVASNNSTTKPNVAVPSRVLLQFTKRAVE